MDCHSSSYPKALGVAWGSVKDTMSTDVMTQGTYAPTKRGILSDVSKTFDVLGWITPVILPMKILFHELWQLKVDWDDPIPENLKLSHQIWREELPLLADLELSRCYYLPEASLNVQLHGFSDASEKAFAAVVYLRSTYLNSPPTCRLVVAKSRVAPLKQRTIPELELCGAVLLADLLESTQTTLDLATEHVTAWSDSTIVLCWLQNSPARYKTFVANRITSATNHFPPSMWYHVLTEENPADCASRGLSARELREHELWWSGPPWLKLDPVAVPKQPQKSALESLQDQEARPSTCMLLTNVPTVWLAHRCRSYNKLVKVTAWVNRAYYNFSSKIYHHPLNKDPHLSVEEVSTAEIFLIKRSQRRTFSKEIRLLTASPPKSLPLSSHIISLHPFMGRDGLLHIGGRLSKAPMSFEQKHPILLSARDELTHRHYKQVHLTMSHCGPTLLFSSAGQKFYCTGARQLARQVCHQCIVCRKVAVRTQTQLMGQLPAARITPAPAFTTTGVDYVGPFFLKDGTGRRPRLVKGYLAVFVCFSTKAIHLEVVRDMTTEAFLAAMKRFVSKRGLPKDLHSDNGGNFIGAKKDLEELYEFLSTAQLPEGVRTFLLDNRMIWHTIPDRAPHFGGLWEAAVKSAKYHLKRVLGDQHLTYEEMSTVTCQVEACLNSRPLGIQHCLSPDGIRPLTPGHFLIQRELMAYPKTAIDLKISLCKRWTLCQAIVQQFWKRWAGKFVQQLQAAQKWNAASPNLAVGDIVLMKDASAFQTHWGLAKVTAVFPGQDGLVRAADVLTKKVIIPEPSVKRPILPSQLKVKTCILRRPITKLALLTGRMIRPLSTVPPAAQQSRVAARLQAARLQQT